MITRGDIRNILYKDAFRLGISEVYPKENVPEGDVTSERVVIVAKGLSTDTIWNKCFCNINIEVPDLDEFGNADLPRTDELERMSQSLFDGVCGMFDGTAYTYTWDEISTDKDNGLHCHFVSVRILFEVLNVK